MTLTAEIPPNSFISISGGVDSVAAAYILKTRFGVDQAYHFNHRLRPQNDEMERQVKELCKNLGIELIVKRATTKLRTEAECRHARVNGFFNSIGGNLITAHHLDDAVESYLLNCFRGQPDYLPIPKVSQFGQYSLLHPFLLFEKEEFRKIARHKRLLSYIVEDETNNEVRGSRRNFIRNKIVPLLEQEQLGIRTIVKKRYETQSI